MLISKVHNRPFYNIYFENLFNDYDIDRTAIYMLPRLVRYNTYMQSFQYKISNNVLFLNKKFPTFGIKPSLYVLSAVYTTKHLFTYSINVTRSNAYGRT